MQKNSEQILNLTCPVMMLEFSKLAIKIVPVKSDPLWTGFAPHGVQNHMVNVAWNAGLLIPQLQLSSAQLSPKTHEQEVPFGKLQNSHKCLGFELNFFKITLKTSLNSGSPGWGQWGISPKILLPHLHCHLCLCSEAIPWAGEDSHCIHVCSNSLLRLLEHP